VAHDFNNMLTAIKAYGDLLLAALEKDDPRRDDALEVTKAADRAAALTRQLLAFSRRQVLEPRVLDVNRVITELEQMLRRLLVGDVEIGMELDPSLWAVLADASQLEQVLVNLVVNARDAMPHGGSLTIRTENVVVGAERSAATTHVPAKPGKYVRLSVTDSGVGMTPETQARMFEPFYTTKERGKGTGLGLSTVYGIVHQSGGDIGVTSMLGQGTTFDIFLPRADALPTPRPTTPTVSRPSGRPTTVLVVDDDAAIRQAVRRMLSAEGYQVIEAANGREAIAEVERIGDQIGILVTDVMMPEMSGRELARAARERLPDVGVLLTSGYDDARGTGPDIAEQGFAFLAKPFRAVSLLDAVARLLGPHATPEKG
jgi:CheY-like chemotaxis protein